MLKNLLLLYILKGNTPETLHKLFTKASKHHNYETKMFANDNLYINFSRLELQRRSFSRVGTLIWNSIDLNSIDLNSTHAANMSLNVKCIKLF